MDKKAQGISLNVIIIAAIALVVLVVLIAIFAGQTGKLPGEIEEVASAEVFRVQAMSTSRCVPSKQGIQNAKNLVAGLSEIQANSQYNEEIQRILSVCRARSQPTKTDEDNRIACNQVAECVWR